MAAGGSYLFGPFILGVELWIAWAGIDYARLILRADWLVIEDDSSIVGWIQCYARRDVTHPLL